MRVLVVSNLYPPIVRGGYEIECSEVAAMLAVEHDVTVLTSSHERSTVGAAPERPAVRRELDLVEVSRAGTLRAPLANVRGARTMRRVLEQVAPDLAFVWNAVGLPASALGVLADSGIPTAFRVCEHWFGGLFTTDQFARYLQPGVHGRDRAWAGVVGAVDRAFGLRMAPGRRPTPAAVSWASEALREAAGVPPAVTAVLQRTIMPTTQRVETLLELERSPLDGPAQIAYLGRMEALKGPDVAVGALARLRDDHGVDARLVLAGPATQADRARIAQMAQSAGVTDAVDLRGPVDGAGVARLLAQSTVLVAPSLWQEPSGMVILEGAAAGIAVVASRVGGMPEALEPDTQALFFEPGDTAACAAAIAATLGDPDATQARIARARERARELSAAYGPAMQAFVADAAAALGAGTGAV